MWTGEKMLLNRWNKSFHLSCGFHFSSGTFSPNNWTIWEVVFWGGTTLNWAKVNISSLRATSFNHTPFTYKTSDGRNGGWESKIVETMAESLNFRQSHVHMIHVQPPRFGQSYFVLWSGWTFNPLPTGSCGGKTSMDLSTAWWVQLLHLYWDSSLASFISGILEGKWT